MMATIDGLTVIIHPDRHGSMMDKIGLKRYMCIFDIMKICTIYVYYSLFLVENLICVVEKPGAGDDSWKLVRPPV